MYAITIRTALLILLLAGPMPALAGEYHKQQLRYEWTPVYAGDDAVVEVDLARVRPLPEGQSRIWTRWFWAVPRRHGDADVVVSVVLSDFDCQALSSRQLVTVYKDDAGEIVFVEEIEPEDAPWTAFVADSPGAATARLICRLIAERQR